MTKTALLIIDMQNDFVREGAPLRVKDAEKIIGNVRSALELFRARSLPVFHVLRIQRHDGSDVEISRRGLFKNTPFAVEGTEGACVINELEWQAGISHRRGRLHRVAFSQEAGAGRGPGSCPGKKRQFIVEN